MLISKELTAARSRCEKIRSFFKKVWEYLLVFLTLKMKKATDKKKWTGSSINVYLKSKIFY